MVTQDSSSFSGQVKVVPQFVVLLPSATVAAVANAIQAISVAAAVESAEVIALSQDFPLWQEN